VDITEETLAVDLINKVGPLPGHFLGQAHTRQWWRKEQYLPKVTDRKSYADWLVGGKKGVLELAKEKFKEIKSSYTLEPLSSSQEQAVRPFQNSLLVSPPAQHVA
jgi:trimethylamine--corrinoid protein Co-methyltransferase